MQLTLLCLIFSYMYCYRLYLSIYCNRPTILRNTITFSKKKQQFHAYVYKLDDKKIELIHSHSNGPQKCKHNARLNYADANFDPIEDNGDSDLENLDKNGEKIKIDTTN